VKTGQKNIGLAGVILLRISYLMVAITENCHSNLIRRGELNEIHPPTYAVVRSANLSS